MKKLLLAASLAFAGASALSIVPTNNIKAQAKSYDLKASTVKAYKKGTFPDAKGSIGTKLSTLKKKSGIQKGGDSFAPQFWQPKGQIQYLFYTPQEKTSSKVLSISKLYNYKINKNSFDRNFKFISKSKSSSSDPGYPVYTYFYKAGKYYIGLTYLEENTNISIALHKKNIFN